MTTIKFNKEVFNNGTTVSQIMAFALIKGVDRCEVVIKNTYTKEDANRIIEILNSVK